jgi:hypothetical protein
MCLSENQLRDIRFSRRTDPNVPKMNFITGPLSVGDLKYWGTNGTSDLLNAQGVYPTWAHGT